MNPSKPVGANGAGTVNIGNTPAGSFKVSQNRNFAIPTQDIIKAVGDSTYQTYYRCERQYNDLFFQYRQARGIPISRASEQDIREEIEGEVQWLYSMFTMYNPNSHLSYEEIIRGRLSLAIEMCRGKIDDIQCRIEAVNPSTRLPNRDIEDACFRRKGLHQGSAGKKKAKPKKKAEPKRETTQSGDIKQRK